MKADDNIFIRMPLYLKYLEVLPREKLNVGKAVGYPKEFSNEISWQTIGYASTLLRDVLKEIVDYRPLKDLVGSEIKFRNFEKYIAFRALNKDIMVGEVIRNKLKFVGLLTVNMQELRYVMHASKDLFEYMVKKEDIIVFHHIELIHYCYLAWSNNSTTKQHSVRHKFSTVDRTWEIFRCDTADKGFKYLVKKNMV